MKKPSKHAAMAWNIGVGLTVLLALIYVAAQMVRGMHMLNGLTP